MIIGLLSDTHGYFDESLSTHFEKCDEIWHAGDIGDVNVITSLKQLAPVCAVYGNIDDLVIRKEYAEDLWMERGGLQIWITHIAGRPPRYNPRIGKILRERKPGVLVCGHSHICEVKKDEKYNLLFINPGAAGQQGFHRMRTALRLDLGEGRVRKLEVIELGLRGRTA